jgi:hypothetical protein
MAGPARSIEAAPATLAIPPRFCGPPGTGNGGYVAGLLAAHAGARGPVEVTLRRPAPLGAPLAFARTDSGDGEPLWTLASGEGVVAEARLAREALGVDPPVRPDPRRAAAAPPRADHPFPRCFVCGPARGPGDGLRIAPAPVPGAGGVVAAPWTPPVDLADAHGRVEPAVVWAALDCPGYFACMGAAPLRPLLLGRIAADLVAPVRAGEPCAIVAWALAREGRRHGAASAIVDAGGRVLARSTQVWIAPRAA